MGRHQSRGVAASNGESQLLPFLHDREVGEGARPLKEGCYLGHHGRTGTLLVVTPEGVKRGTGVCCLAEDEQWNFQGGESLKGHP